MPSTSERFEHRPRGDTPGAWRQVNNAGSHCDPSTAWHDAFNRLHDAEGVVRTRFVFQTRAAPEELERHGVGLTVIGCVEPVGQSERLRRDILQRRATELHHLQRRAGSVCVSRKGDSVTRSLHARVCLVVFKLWIAGRSCWTLSPDPSTTSTGGRASSHHPDTRRDTARLDGRRGLAARWGRCWCAADRADTARKSISRSNGPDVIVFSKRANDAGQDQLRYHHAGGP